MNIDIAVGQMVAWHGYDAKVIYFDGSSVYLEMLEGEMEGEVTMVSYDELIEQNEDLVIDWEEDETSPDKAYSIDVEL